MSDGLTLPLAVVSSAGNLLGALLMNRKAFNKSIERRELWVVHPSTGRVLPLDSIGYTLLTDKEGSWYQAIIPADEAEAFLAAKAALEQDEATEANAKTAAAGSSPTLEKLAQVIKGRRQTMPAGSYTTHLFEKGEEKIRKKTGEEAIELLLARTKAEMTYEAADLIYHLLVLLEVTDIPVADVLAELEGRMK